MFGMGTGVTPPVRSPETWKSSQQSTVHSQQLRARRALDFELLTLDCSLNSVASSLMFGGHQPPLKKGELLTVDS